MHHGLAGGGVPVAAGPRPRRFSAVIQSDAMAFCAAPSDTRPEHTAAFSAFSTLSLGLPDGLPSSGHRFVASLLPPSSSGTRWSSSLSLYQVRP